MNYLFSLWTMTLPISASKVVGIIGISHWCHAV
jgi:hypothetical protein